MMMSIEFYEVSQAEESDPTSRYKATAATLADLFRDLATYLGKHTVRATRIPDMQTAYDVQDAETGDPLGVAFIETE